MNENQLANTYLRMLNRTLNEGISLSQDVIWDLAKKMAHTAQSTIKPKLIYTTIKTKTYANKMVKTK